jgi:eukaryotic-like serine/threonine-protein kinase
MRPRELQVIVRESGQEPRLHLLPAGTHLVGRERACAIQLTSPDVSRQHVRLVWSEERVSVEDLGSKSGVKIKGQLITGQFELDLPQTLQVGSALLELLRPPEPEVDTVAERLKGRKYKIEGPVGEGGMGTVLAVKDLHARRTVAMKVLRDPVHASGEWRRRFIREAEVLGQLEHPNIVPLHDLGLDEQGQVFYTMKFVNGATLAEVLEDLKLGRSETAARYPLRQLLGVFQKVCDAVAFAHSRRVIHRDLKPENIMVGDYGEVLVMDWGLAKVLSGDRKREAVGETDLTRRSPAPLPEGESATFETMSGMVMGTPGFMAPEQADGRTAEMDFRTDIYALGGILYKILTLQSPVTGKSAAEVIEKARAGDIVSPLKSHCAGREIPSSLAAVAMKALAFKPEDRYQTVLELQKDLEAYQSGFTTSAERPGFFKALGSFMKRRTTASSAAPHTEGR